MARRTRWSIVVALLLGFCATARAQQGYIDETVVKVKQGKGADFEALIKKMVAANRENNGDNWIAVQTLYGDSSTITFSSVRDSYAAAQKGSDDFEHALAKAMGPAGADKLFNDLGECIAEMHGLLLLRRQDLSANLPTDPSQAAKMVGNSRVVRTLRFVVRPDQAPKFEQVAKQVKAAQEKADPNFHSWVAQSAAGERDGVYYVTQFRSSLGAFDNETPLPQVMGEEAFQNMVKEAAGVIASEEITVGRLEPELSNPPDVIASAAPDFWRPAANP
jgi:quinol monooxygenase YgiN